MQYVQHIKGTANDDGSAHLGHVTEGHSALELGTIAFLWQGQSD